ncbi:MAG: peptidoglycan DD-metalloendopeptidase family protein [Tidjanibacter sp.]|nr:peptidoglycan DD-metalloendopeptidase family protein [Tidjanibacter sp.]
MSRLTKTIVLVAASLLFVVNLGAQQTIASLNAEIEQAQRDIARNTALLNDVRKSEKNNSIQIRLIGERISKRQKIVRSLDSQIALITKEIAKKDRSIDECGQQINVLRKQYAEMVRAAYKDYKLNNATLFLFSADDFNSATRRLYFMQRYNQMRRSKAEEIASLSNTLEADLAALNLQREELERTKNDHRNALSQLSTDKKELDQTDKHLRTQAKKLDKEIKAKEAQKRKAQQQLKNIIDDEARKNKRKTSDAERRMIAELNGRFDQNRGKMIVPVNGGVIIDHFGTHPHPTQKNMKIENKGINIAAPKGSAVYSVFEGTVARVMFINGLNKCVLLNHGDYFTIYSNLTRTEVNVGDRVASNSVIGYISDGSDPDEYQLHFELWRSTTCLDPEEWISIN